MAEPGLRRAARQFFEPAYVAARRADSEFTERRKRYQEEFRDVLDKLAEGDEPPPDVPTNQDVERLRAWADRAPCVTCAQPAPLNRDSAIRVLDALEAAQIQERANELIKARLVEEITRLREALEWLLTEASETVVDIATETAPSSSSQLKAAIEAARSALGVEGEGTRDGSTAG